MLIGSAYNTRIKQLFGARSAANYASATLPSRMSPRATMRLPGVRYWRTQRLLTQDELAKKAGLHWTSISRVENNKPADIDTVRKLAAALEVEPAELMAQPPNPD
jgi:DNA-binding XRE family transcriptional regulator